MKRVELGYDFIRNPETDPSAIHVAMPWLLENAKLTFDVPGGVVRSGEDQIPGTSASWNTVQNFVAARNDDAQILVSGSEVPLYLLGKLLDDPYRQPRTYEKPHVFPWLMNNYWTTNFRASQEGGIQVRIRHQLNPGHLQHGRIAVRLECTHPALHPRNAGRHCGQRQRPRPLIPAQRMQPCADHVMHPRGQRRGHPDQPAGNRRAGRHSYPARRLGTRTALYGGRCDRAPAGRPERHFAGAETL
ncbi:MAG: hypothetical protein ACLUQ6_04330 [Alistipes onderdonkii]